MSKKGVRIFFIIAIISISLSFGILAMNDPMELELLFDEPSDWFGMLLSSIYLIAIYSYGFSKRIFTHKWQLSILLLSAPLLGFISLTADFYEYWGYISFNYILINTVFSVFIYGYVTSVLYKLRSEYSI